LDDGGNYILNSTGDYDLINLTPHEIMAQGNLWWSGESAAIDSRIYDDDEAPASGLVDFSHHYRSGVITGDEAWEGEVRVGGDIIIPEGVEVKVMPGTVVKVAPHHDGLSSGVDPMRVEIIVAGGITFKDGGNPSRFISDGYAPEPGDWYGIRFVRGKREEGGGKREERTVKNTRVNHAERGVSAEGVKLSVKKTRFNDCNLGIYATGKALEVKKTRFDNDSIGIYFAGSNWIEVRDCTLALGDYGIWIDQESSVDIKRSHIKDFSTAGIYYHPEGKDRVPAGRPLLRGLDPKQIQDSKPLYLGLKDVAATQGLDGNRFEVKRCHIAGCGTGIDAA
ncbi:MAG TPA: right-handed parallel beta-helix repeat-containing protein, partial [Methanophagales archaeon]|nr:right-handed parallel beta-helix repeat-containing protein [Methanophagales archaeon]